MHIYSYLYWYEALKYKLYLQSLNGPYQLNVQVHTQDMRMQMIASAVALVVGILFQQLMLAVKSVHQILLNKTMIQHSFSLKVTNFEAHKIESD